jgi:PUA-domain protein
MSFYVMSQNIKNRHRLKNREINKLIDTLNKDFENIVFLDRKSTLEVGDVEGIRFVLVNGQAVLMYFEGRLCLTLKGIEFFKIKERFVVVDMGAVKFVSNGADVMSPGIINADKNIKENDFVWVCDERNKKALAVGFAKISGEEMISSESGKAVRIIHHVGDVIWSFVAKSL